MPTAAVDLAPCVPAVSSRSLVLAARGARTAAAALFLLMGVLRAATVSAVEPCRIDIVEAGSGWPAPLVELRTVNDVRFVSDNAGVIAFDLPEGMHRETWFTVSGHGYTVRPDGFGYRGVKLTPTPGGRLKVEVQRTIVARRLGRITGSGLFAESQKVDPALTVPESGVLGSDSVQNAVYNGKLYWFWGDTNLPHYPLGLFHAPAATTAVQPLSSAVPPLRLELNYIRADTGRPRNVAEMPGSGPTWITGVVTLPDRDGREHLVTAYMKVKPPLEAYEWRLAEWNDAKQRFEPLLLLWTRSDEQPQPPPIPEGHPVFWTDEQGQRWVLFGNPLPTLKCPATFEAWQNPAQWTVLAPNTTLTDAATGAAVHTHSGSIAWNDYRQRWVTVFMEKLGKPSAFGELWYAEAPSPLGPWGKAVKVLSHDNYTFYNPRLHPEFSQIAPRALFFEGTYTATFANRPEPTPRYDYNQILYRIDLDDPALRGARE